jgi:nucleotide-binding universal stress UspA family protein
MPAYKKILVLLDLSDDSEQVAIAARDLAAHSNASMLVLHVVEFVPVEPLGESLMPTAQIEDDLIKRSLRSSGAWRSRARSGGSNQGTRRRRFSASQRKKRRISSFSAAASVTVSRSW